MSKLGRLWAGSLYGTNTGNIFIEFDNMDDGITGLLRVHDYRLGLSMYKIRGSFDGVTLDLTSTEASGPEGVMLGTISAKASLTSDGTLRGQWTSTIGSGGTFILHPHDLPAESTSPDTPLREQVNTATRHLGVLRLYADDVRELIDILKKDFQQGRVIATYNERGVEAVRYASDFEADFNRLRVLRYLKLSIQEHEAYGINRFATVELNAAGINTVRVQGVQDTWVTGKAEFLSRFLQTKERGLATTFRKFGLNINALLLIFLIIFVPELSLGRRAIFVLIVIFIQFTILQIHSKLIPNLLVFLADRKPTRIEQSWPTILSWIVAATSGLVATISYGLLKGELPEFAQWFRSLW